MTRVLSSVCAAVLLLGLVGRAHASGKPPIAILGLEVYDNGGGIDPETTRAAKDLTLALRDRAKAGTGPYTPVQGGDKELIDEKLLNNCDSEAPTCMSAIGTELGAEVLMYGKIEKSVQNGRGIYKVSLKLLNVTRKQLASSTVETLPVTESNGVPATTHAKAWYAKLAGTLAGGTLAVRANIDRGTVLLDNETIGNLSSGAFSLPGISEGRHTLAIEAKDYQRYETSITVRTGETTNQNVTLVDLTKKPAVVAQGPISREGTVTTGSKTNIWKPVFYGTVVLDAAAIGYTIWTWRKEVDEGNKVMILNKNGQRAGDADCGDSDLRKNAAFDSACSYHKQNVIGWVVSGVLGAAVVGSFVMAYVRNHDDDETVQTAAGGRRKRREFAVTPIVTPDGGGATLRFDW